MLYTDCFDIPESRHNAIKSPTTINVFEGGKAYTNSSWIGNHTDTIGIIIHKADRTNTDSNLLPCKTLEVKVMNDSSSLSEISRIQVCKNNRNYVDDCQLVSFFNCAGKCWYVVRQKMFVQHKQNIRKCCKLHCNKFKINLRKLKYIKV